MEEQSFRENGESNSNVTKQFDSNGSISFLTREKRDIPQTCHFIHGSNIVYVHCNNSFEMLSSLNHLQLFPQDFLLFYVLKVSFTNLIRKS